MTLKMPRIYLAVDNCFASKRWTRPEEWARVIGEDMGLRCVEASADNEIDPLYSTSAVRRSWVAEVRRVRARTGVRVVNLYSGHGTYATLGLGHIDVRVRDHILHDWIRPMTRMAGELGAGLGFFAHAFPQSVLEDRAAYEEALDDLIDRLAQAARYGVEAGARVVAVEQMYSPHQPPWTLEGARHLLTEAWRRRKAPLYVTIDVGHQYGQSRFLRPTPAQIERWVKAGGRSDRKDAPWVGTSRARDGLRAAGAARGRARDGALADLNAEMDAHPHLFATPQDGDPYAWLERFAAYSPIIHLQQTDNSASAHKAFTADHNARGIIEPGRVLRAIRAAYARPPDPAMPPRVEALYLTLEMFSGTADKPDEILVRMRDSAAYWRRAIPEDGLPLDALSV